MLNCVFSLSSCLTRNTACINHKKCRSQRERQREHCLSEQSARGHKRRDLQVKCLLFLPDFNKIGIQLPILITIPNMKCHGNCSSNSRSVPLGRTDMTRLIVTSRMFFRTRVTTERYQIKIMFLFDITPCIFFNTYKCSRGRLK
jgi:hypothetical protein